MKLNSITHSKIFPVSDLREIDRYTIDNEPISSIKLMERAATNVFLKFIELYKSKNKRIVIFAGTGNNGGDAVVIARLLAERAYKVELYLLAFSAKISPETEINIDRYKNVSNSFYRKINSLDLMPKLSRDDIVIDGLVGTGLRSSLDGKIAEVIRIINKSSCEVVSIDIPSGLQVENNPYVEASHIIAATHTITIEFPKLSFFFAENHFFVGELHVVPIGLNEDIIRSKEVLFRLINSKMVSRILKSIPKFSHKTLQGHALLVAGSKGMMGCVLLAGKAAMRTGVGLLSIKTISESDMLIHSCIPEALIHQEDKQKDYSTVAIGTGLGKENEARIILEKQLRENNKALVIDADAINIISENIEMMKLIPKNSILTPHVGEFSRLVGRYSNSYERIIAQREFAKKYKIYIVLKGPYTSVATPSGKVFFNTTGNQGMSTAGSGDVLTGIILSLLAQGYTSEESALLGVYLHGFAGDLGADELGMHSLIASDLIDFIPYALKEITNYTRFA